MTVAATIYPLLVLVYHCLAAGGRSYSFPTTLQRAIRSSSSFSCVFQETTLASDTEATTCTAYHVIREEAANAPDRDVHDDVEPLIVRRRGSPPLPGVAHPRVPRSKLPLLPETFVIRSVAKVHGQQAVVVRVEVCVLIFFIAVCKNVNRTVVRRQGWRSLYVIILQLYVGSHDVAVTWGDLLASWGLHDGTGFTRLLTWGDGGDEVR